MQPEDSVLCSQGTATDPCPEPDELIHTLTYLFLNTHFRITFLTTSVSPSGLFPSDFRIKFCVNFW
jgi:hypothetical protein